jgi:hypothetical protein
MKRILVKALAANMYSPAVGLSITTGENIRPEELIGKEFTGWAMDNPAVVNTLKDMGIDARMSEKYVDHEGNTKTKQVYVQSVGDEIYAILDPEGKYINQFKDQEKLPDGYVITCKKYVVTDTRKRSFLERLYSFLKRLWRRLFHKTKTV